MTGLAFTGACIGVQRGSRFKLQKHEWARCTLDRLYILGTINEYQKHLFMSAFSALTSNRPASKQYLKDMISSTSSKVGIIHHPTKYLPDHSQNVSLLAIVGVIGGVLDCPGT